MASDECVMSCHVSSYMSHDYAYMIMMIILFMICMTCFFIVNRLVLSHARVD